MVDKKIIWLCWFQGELHSSLQKLNKQCIHQWRKFNWDCDVVVLTYATINKYVPEFFDILNKSPKRTFQAQSDLLRLLLLYKHGGVWVDSSVYPVKPLRQFYRDIVNQTNFFAYRVNNQLRTSSWFLCVDESHHYLVSAWMEKFIENFISLSDWPYFTLHDTLSEL